MTPVDSHAVTGTYPEVLQVKRGQVLADIERLGREASDITARLGAMEAQLRNLNELLALEGHPAAEPLGSSELGLRRGSTSRRFLDAAWEVLKQTGKPLHYRELADRLITEGIAIPGQDPPANLIAHMARDGRFGRAAGRGVYGLSEWSTVKAASKGRTPGPGRAMRAKRLRRA